MYGGLLKSASAVAIFAAAGLFASANAADLGGDCCADLEERVAELEATTVRKGNRKVSLQISGIVGHQVMWWDDGGMSDAYIGDGGNIFSRFRFTGSAKISPSLTAGFTYEFAANANSITAANQLNGGDDLGASGATGAGSDCANGSTGGCATLRDSTVWLRHNHLGMVRIGQGSTATDNLVLIDLGARSSAGTPDIGLYNGAFRLRNLNGSLTGSAGAIGSDGVGTNAITWNNLITGAESWDTFRRNHVLYETPTLAGFTLQAAVAEDNYWDVALRYAGEFGGFRLAGGIGYREDTEFNAPVQFAGVAPNALCLTNCERKESAVLGSASIMHIPTGLFLTGAAGQRERDGGITDTNIGTVDNRKADSSFWHISAGISQNFFGIGRTVIFGEYSNASDAARMTFNDVISSDMDHWGVGVNQYIDAAGAMEIFATYKHFDAEITRNIGTLAAPVAGKLNFQDFQTVIVGTRINF
ncbi:MAG: porin [Hyphomicrobiaceae bacterium]|nr:porin [Hyphomicrobiaceae bacterium]